VRAVNRRGRALQVRVFGSALRDAGDEVVGVMLTIEEIVE
jgi:hypothetical protein